jgi:uncharacterized LabA/DUF88 family protein
VTQAYVFIGYVESNQNLYEGLKLAGFILIFKPVSFDHGGKIKGNCDADLVLHMMIRINEFDRAVIVTSDGDFYSLVKYLYENNKIEMVLSAHIKKCSKLLRKEAKEKINYINDLRKKIAK